MRFFLVTLLMVISLFSIARAEPNLENLYTNPKGKHLPEVIIFYNTANTCEHCKKAIDMLISVLKANYQTKLHAYLINMEQHPEFIHAFKLHGPLSLVAIRISDEASFGYKKLDGLQSMINDKSQFNRRITEFIDNFLNFKPKISN